MSFNGDMIKQSVIQIISQQQLFNRTVKNQVKMCQPSRNITSFIFLAFGCLLLVGPISLQADEQQSSKQLVSESAGIRSTQPTVDRQVGATNSLPVMSWSAPSVPQQTSKIQEPQHAKETNAVSKPPCKSCGKRDSSQKNALASQQNYDKYQLKATNSHVSTSATPEPIISGSPTASDPLTKPSGDQVDKSSQNKVAHKKAGFTSQQNNKAKSSFSLFKKLFPSFMSSAGPVAAAAAAATALVDKHQVSHSRSSQSGLNGDGAFSKASGKIINLLSSKKSGLGGDNSPFFVRKSTIDRQAGFASSLLSNPLSLGLLFSAPLIPSLLLTPLAIAGLSPAMSAINNFFGDDEEVASTPAPSALSMLMGPSSPLSNILQGSASQTSGSAPQPSFALQAVQSILGPSASTEKPLFNPGLFASQGIQTAVGALSSSSPSLSSPHSSLGSLPGQLSSPSNSPIRSLLGGNFIQTAASMISPSFAAPPVSSGSSGSPSSSTDSDDGPGFMQMASDVFDKVANYMNTDKDVSTASGQTASATSSPLSSLVSMSSFSPFQLSSLFASSPLAPAIATSPALGGSSSGATGTTHRAGFFSTLRNVYELFSSSFLRRQEVDDSNECQQRLICELHQRAMNSKLFRRSVQANLMELVNLDKSMQDQIRNNPMQARVDADTKAMLNDFLKATNSFKNGRDLVNCSKMFPKCSRSMLLSAVNAQLGDQSNIKAIGKFSTLMKKMKFKSAQQHQNQVKLRKPTTINSNIQPIRTVPGSQYQSADYLQVAPLSTNPNMSGKPQAGQLTPADSLKLVQQIMLMQQQQQQQLQQQRQNLQYQSQPVVGTPFVNSQQQYGQQSNNQVYSSPQSYSNFEQYQSSNPQVRQMSNMYTDAVQPSMYSSATDSPYYIQPQPAADVSMHNSKLMSVPQQQQPQPMMQSSQQQQVAHQNYQQYPTSTSILPEHMVLNSDKKALQQTVAAKAAGAA